MQTKCFPSVLLCGFERGGTTLLSEIFRNNGYESGFECGVLMCDKPSDFSRYMPYANMIQRGWRLDRPIENYIPTSDSFLDFYHNIITSSGLSEQATLFFDKTPIYMKEIGKCLSKAPFIEKAVIITRDPRSIFSSWAKRNKDSESLSIEQVVKKNLKQYSNRYNRYFAGAIAERDNPKVLYISYEDLCLNPDEAYQTIGVFIQGQAFESLQKASRFTNNMAENKVKSCKVSEYDSLLSGKLQKKILSACDVSAMFFASNEQKNNHLKKFTVLDEKIKAVLSRYKLDVKTIVVDGKPFNPWLYLYLNRKLLAKKVNPLTHFKTVGIEENFPY